MFAVEDILVHLIVNFIGKSQHCGLLEVEQKSISDFSRSRGLCRWWRWITFCWRWLLGRRWRTSASSQSCSYPWKTLAKFSADSKRSRFDDWTWVWSNNLFVISTGCGEPFCRHSDAGPGAQQPQSGQGWGRAVWGGTKTGIHITGGGVGYVEGYGICGIVSGTFCRGIENDGSAKFCGTSIGRCEGILSDGVWPDCWWWYWGCCTLGTCCIFDSSISGRTCSSCCCRCCCWSCISWTCWRICRSLHVSICWNISP